MTNIFLPTNVEYQPDAEDKNKGRVIVEPCYPGYGTTWGNALRRVLLTSLEGAAVSAVKIKGVRYEFSTIDHVQEDVLDIILNLKALRLRVFRQTDESIKLTLRASGEGKVLAGDIDKSADVEIVNPDLFIATLTDKRAKLEMELWVEKGYGWIPSEEKTREGRDIGVIIIDSVFSPVLKVAVGVENVRVGKRTDYDKLILDIETDGSIPPLGAFLKAAKLLAEQFNNLTDLGEKMESEKESVSPKSRQKGGKAKKAAAKAAKKSSKAVKKPAIKKRNKK